MSTTSPERRLLHLGLFLSVLASTVAGLALGLSLHATLIAQDAPSAVSDVPADDPALAALEREFLGRARADEVLAPGARVVARWQDAFWEATVVAVQGELVTVAWDQPPPELSYRPHGWVVRMDVSPAYPKAGDWLLCRADSRVWNLCRVKSVDGDALEIVAITDARPRTTARADTLLVPVGLEDWAKGHGALTLARARLAAFLKGVEPVTAGKPARVRDRVLARWTDGSWWEAEVKAVSGGQITVAWADGSAPTALPPADVAPLANAPVPRASEVALCKWGEGTRWWQALITDDADGVLYEDGTSEPLREQCVAGRTSGQ